MIAARKPPTILVRAARIAALVLAVAGLGTAWVLTGGAAAMFTAIVTGVGAGLGAFLTAIGDGWNWLVSGIAGLF